MENEKVFIVVGQTFWQSVLSDLFTLGSLAFCIWLSVYLGSVFWQVFVCLCFLIPLFGKIASQSMQYPRFKDKNELREWATPQAHESVQNGTCDEVAK